MIQKRVFLVVWVCLLAAAFLVGASPANVPLSRRDAIAAYALAAIISKTSQDDRNDRRSNEEFAAAQSRGAVLYADALLRQLDGPVMGAPFGVPSPR